MSGYNLRSRRSDNLPGQRPSGGDGPSEPIDDRRTTLPMRLSLRRDSMRAQVGSRRNSQLSGNTRTSGSSANSGSSRGQTSTDATATSTNAEADHQIQNADDVPPCQEQQTEETPTTPSSPTIKMVHKKNRWTTEMNKFLLKTFLELSSRKDRSNAFSKELRDRFVAKFPQMENLTAETVMRQKSRICNKNILTREDIEDVEKEIQAEQGPSVSATEQAGPATVSRQDVTDVPMCDRNTDNPESKRNSDTQLEYNFSNINNPDNDNEELPKLAQENQFTLKQDIPKRRKIE